MLFTITGKTSDPGWENGPGIKGNRLAQRAPDETLAQMATLSRILKTKVGPKAHFIHKLSYHQTRKNHYKPTTASIT